MIMHLLAGILIVCSETKVDVPITPLLGKYAESTLLILKKSGKGVWNGAKFILVYDINA